MSDQDSLKQILICKLCNELYEDPLILPCGKFVCSKHVNEANDDVFKCFLCSKKHPIPIEGFSKNDDLTQLIRISDKYVNIDSMLGEKNTKAVELCSKLEEIINKCELLSKDPLLFLYEYFSKLKSDLDLNREQCVKMINENFNRILNEIEEAESKCNLNIYNLESSVSILNESIKSSKEKYGLLLNLSKKPELNYETKWFKFKNDIEKAISQSKYMINKFQNELLLNKNYEFKLKSNLNETNNFGDLIVKNDDFINENRLQGTINFEIDQFKSFRYEKSARYDRDWCVIDNIRWTAYAKIKENSNYEQNLALYVKPDIEELKSPIKAKVTFKILKTNDVIHKQKLLEYSFQGIDGEGYSNFSSLKDMFDAKNAIYDKENDSIKLKVDIQIIK